MLAERTDARFDALLGSRRGGGRPREDTYAFGRWQTLLDELLDQARGLRPGIFDATGLLTEDSAVLIDAHRTILGLDAADLLDRVLDALALALPDDERARKFAEHAALGIICHGELLDHYARDLYCAWADTLNLDYPWERR